MQTDKPGSLGDKFDGFGAAPTDQLWNSIASSLDQKEKKKRGAFWWWFGGIAASVALLFGIYQLGYQAGKSESATTVTPDPVYAQNPDGLITEDIAVSESTSENENKDENKVEGVLNSSENKLDQT